MENSLQKNYNVYVGTYSGILKALKCKEGGITCHNYIKQDQTVKKRVVSLTCLNEKEVRVCCSNWSSMIFNSEDGCFKTVRNFPPPDKSEMVAGYSFPNDGGCIIGASRSGIIKIFKEKSLQFVTCNDNARDRRMKSPNLECMKFNPYDINQIATGGCENDLSLWDLYSIPTKIFKAKNVPPDMLQLRVPIHISDLDFLDKSTIATCTRYQQIRVYDTRIKRPGIDFSWEESPFTKIVSIPNLNRQVIVGTSHGRMASFDLRKPKAPLNIYKFFEGSVQDIECHPKLPLIFSVSSDRFLRIHHLNTNHLLYKEFLKSRLSRLRLGEIDEKELPFDLNNSKKNNNENPMAKKLKVK